MTVMYILYTASTFFFWEKVPSQVGVSFRGATPFLDESSVRFLESGWTIPDSSILWRLMA